jgi:hypothetical protein
MFKIMLISMTLSITQNVFALSCIQMSFDQVYEQSKSIAVIKAVKDNSPQFTIVRTFKGELAGKLSLNKKLWPDDMDGKKKLWLKRVKKNQLYLAMLSDNSSEQTLGLCDHFRMVSIECPDQADAIIDQRNFSAKYQCEK